MDINEFKIKFNEIKNMGYIKSLRSGSTGIGKTFETLLGINENNLKDPDLGEIELKAHKENSSNLITLFTFNKGAWEMKPLEAIRKYGKRDGNGRLGLYFTMSFKQNSAGLFLTVDDKFVYIKHIDGNTIIKWNFIDLEKQFKRKIPAMILVYARSEIRNNLEYFHYYKALYLREPDHSLIKEEIKNETILIDLRLHDKGTIARNHGTGFRIFEKDLLKVFKYAEII